MEQLLILALRLYLALVLGVAGLAKIEDPTHFTALLRKQGLLSGRALNVVGSTFPWAELLLSALLVLGVFPSLSAAFTAITFIGFLIYDLILLAKKNNVECGCFGSASSRKVSRATAATSVILALVALVHWHLQQRSIIPTWQQLPFIIGFLALEGWLLWKTIRKRTVSLG